MNAAPRRGVAVAIVALLLILVAVASRCGAAAPPPTGEPATDGRYVAAPAEAPAEARPARTVPPAPARDVPAAPPSVDDGYAEWGDMDWLQVATPPVTDGALHVVVTRGRAPVAGALVRVWAEAAGGADAACAGAGVPWGQAWTDAAGRARFAAPPSEALAVRADCDGDHLVRLHVAPERDLHRAILLPFGRSAIEGVVRDDGGAPLPAFRVAIAGLGPLPRAADSLTDREGRFRIAGLCAGRYHVMADGRTAAFVPDDQRQVTLGIESTVFVAFGTAADAVRWRGALVDAEGDVVPGRRQLAIVDPETGDERHLVVGVDGRFAVRVSPGRFVVRDDGGLFQGADLATVDVPPGGLDRDLPTPARRVVLDVVVEAGSALDLPGLAQQLWLDGPGTHRQRPEGPFPGPRGPFVQWLVQHAGAFEVASYGSARFVGPDPERFRFVVEPEQRVHRGALFVR
ncbi:MAG: carboxypeptidase-like regulatory domain-containing protein [Planctomycetota bacterium]